MTSLYRRIFSPTLVAEGSQVQGGLSFQNEAQVDGIVEGDLTQRSVDSLKVGKTGWVRGNVSSKGTIYIEGRVDGNIESEQKIHLASTARVQGRCEAPKIEIKAGARMDGDLKMPERPQHTAVQLEAA
jgi:cytoskeletal protein CcmA (bactofilin family)